MNVLFNKIIWFAMLDVMLSGADLVEMEQTGVIEDYFDEPYELNEDKPEYYIKTVIEK